MGFLYKEIIEGKYKERKREREKERERDHMVSCMYNTSRCSQNPDFGEHVGKRLATRHVQTHMYT